MDADLVLMISRLWPMFVAFIILIVTLAQSHYRIKVLEEKVKVKGKEEKINCYSIK